MTASKCNSNVRLPFFPGITPAALSVLAKGDTRSGATPSCGVLADATASSVRALRTTIYGRMLECAKEGAARAR